MEADSFPSELQDRLSKFDNSLSKIEDIFETLHSTPINEIQDNLPDIDKAKLDLVGAYAINSLFWMYLNTKGENPKLHGVKQELDRIRSYMGRIKEMQDKAKAPKLNVEASQKFVRSALWQAAHKKRPEGSDQSPGSPQTSSPVQSKRPRPAQQRDT